MAILHLLDKRNGPLEYKIIPLHVTQDQVRVICGRMALSGVQDLQLLVHL